VRNYPGLLGLNVEETVLFGKRVHGPVVEGLTVDRNPATGCTARLLDGNSRQHLAPLWWRMPRDSDCVQQHVDVGPGQDADLMLFARPNAQRSTYFTYQNKNGKLTELIEPSGDAKFHGPRHSSLAGRAAAAGLRPSGRVAATGRRCASCAGL
jgi:hypothetical protein